MKTALMVSVLAAWPCALIAQPKLAAGKLESVPASSSLAQQIRGFAGPAWVGYQIAAVPAQRGCCYNINNGICSMGCSLEGGSIAGSSCPADQPGGTAFLEGERVANILMRVDHGEIEKVRVFSQSCQVDISSLTLHWLTGVQASASIAFLRALPISSNVIGAIGAHADPAADAFLRETAESTAAPRKDRQRASMILASTRGSMGLGVVKQLFEHDTDEQFRQELLSAIHVAPDYAGTMTLIEAATRDKNRKVREKAFFWLGHSNDPQALQFVSQILAK